jgi:hypothetical protein
MDSCTAPTLPRRNVGLHAWLIGAVESIAGPARVAGVDHASEAVDAVAPGTDARAEAHENVKTSGRV